MTIATDMKNIGSMKVYDAPLVEALDVNVQRVLCQSQSEGTTEQFHGSYSFDGDEMFEDFKY